LLLESLKTHIRFSKRIKLFKNAGVRFTFKQLAVFFVTIVVSVAVGAGVFLNYKREVIIDVDCKKVELSTALSNVKQVLDQSGIILTPYDYINMSLDDKLLNNSITEIYIKRAVPIHVLTEGQPKTLMTFRYKVKDALYDNSIILSEKDRLDGANLEDKIVKDMSFRVIKVTEDITTERVNVPYKVIDRENHNMDRGKTVTARQGRNGTREKKYIITYEDGKQVERMLLSNLLIKAPVNKVIEHGTIMNFTTSRGSLVTYRKVIDMSATSYTASYADTGKHPGDAGFGITYTGIKVHQGIVAVDPRVIPLGSKLYIEGIGNTPDYGFALAADIGGAVKGNIIDLYFESASVSYNWGRRNVRVYILTD
jgi:uncharacterized protein YabE (DUF348 family)